MTLDGVVVILIWWVAGITIYLAARSVRWSAAPMAASATPDLSRRGAKATTSQSWPSPTPDSGHPRRGWGPPFPPERHPSLGPFAGRPSTSIGLSRTRCQAWGRPA